MKSAHIPAVFQRLFKLRARTEEVAPPERRCSNFWLARCWHALSAKVSAS
jgi:hypothetical protein